MSWLVRSFFRKEGYIPLAVLWLAACTSGNYQAPIADRSEITDRQGPEIVSESDDRPSRYIGSGSRSRTVQTRVVANQNPGTHIVARGESLFSIAFQYDLDYRVIAMANNLNPPYTIYIGQELRLDMPATPPVQIQNSGARPEGIIVAAGTPVANSSIARSQAAVTSPGRVTRQPIASSNSENDITASAPLDRPTASPIETSLISPEPLWQWPVTGRIITNFQASEGTDKGIDIAGVPGQAVNAAAAGDVVYAGNGIQGSGNLVIIRHNDRYLSAYAQNRSLLVNEGDRVSAGDRIAELGAGPDGTPLVHFEIRLDGKPVDPMGYLPRL